MIDGVADDAARQSVVRASVALASDVGATVIAEGVEEDRELVAVAGLSVDAAQSNLLARPTTDRSAIRVWSSGWQLDRAINVNRRAERRMAFGRLIRDLRGTRPQVDVLRGVNERLASAGEAARVSQGQYSAYEHGREAPNDVRLGAIEAALDVEAGTLAETLSRAKPCADAPGGSTVF